MITNKLRKLRDQLVVLLDAYSIIRVPEGSEFYDRSGLYGLEGCNGIEDRTALRPYMSIMYFIVNVMVAHFNEFERYDVVLDPNNSDPKFAHTNDEVSFTLHFMKEGITVTAIRKAGESLNESSRPIERQFKVETHEIDESFKSMLEQQRQHQLIMGKQFQC